MTRNLVLPRSVVFLLLMILLGGGAAASASDSTPAPANGLAPEQVWLQAGESADLAPKILAPFSMVPRVAGAGHKGGQITESSSRKLDPKEPWQGSEYLGSIATTSRGYRLELEPAKVRVGTPFYTISAGALVAVQGFDDAAVEIVSGERVLTAAEALESFTADPAMDLPAGVPLRRLKRELGAGRFTLRGANAKAEEALSLYIEEPESSVVLHLSLQRSHFVHGQVLLGSLRLVEVREGKESPVPMVRAEAMALIPGGVVQPVRLVPDAAGGYGVRMSLDARNTVDGEDWELQVQAIGMVVGQRVVRSARTTFKVAFATARLGQPALATRDSATGLTLALPVQVSAAGQFAVSGVLFDAGSHPHPLAQARSVAWLDAGKSTLGLVFGPELFPEGQLEGRLELRDLRLEDISRKSLVQGQALALVLE